ncbi:hypothetical protein JXB11_00325, partial [Candidatus Woesearchaeota archaeon]|nr:hypothetical protein [Candidatus Woesearchaeota archaeon]
MGLFSFLKGFSSKKQAEVKEIKLDELPQWADSLLKEASSKAESQLSEIKAAIEEQKSLMQENIKNLETAKLQNPKIPDRLLQIAEGNRKSYAQKARFFLSKVDFPDSLPALKDFFPAFSEELDHFGKSTVKSYHVLQEFFAQEAKLIALNIKEINILVEKAKSAASSPEMQRLQELKAFADSSLSKIKIKDSLTRQKALAESELQNLAKSISEKEKLVRELEEGEENRKLKELLKRKGIIEHEIKALEADQFHHFSVINAAMKKYERIALDHAPVSKYLEDPLNALLCDKEMKILKIVSGIRESIGNGSIDLRDKKKEKILHGLDIFEKASLEAFVSKSGELQEKLSSLESEISSAEILQKIRSAKEGLSQLQFRHE